MSSTQAIRVQRLSYWKSLKPKRFYRHITQINFAELVAKFGWEYAILDVDGTIAPYGSDRVVDEIVQHILASGLKGVFILSNAPRSGARGRRVAEIAKQLEAHHLCVFGRHSKPRRHGFEKAMEMLGSRPENTVMIGDQIFTDMVGAGRLGIGTVYVQPHGKDGWHTKHKRWLESMLFSLWKPRWE